MSQCMCGATDCADCYPDNFKDGRYVWVECPVCHTEFADEDDTGICPGCVAAEERKAESRRTFERCVPEWIKAQGLAMMAFSIWERARMQYDQEEQEE